jgi:hypothetical protein
VGSRISLAKIAVVAAVLGGLIFLAREVGVYVPRFAEWVDGLGSFTEVIHPYPSQAEAIKPVVGLYTRTRLTSFVKRLFDRRMALAR